ncbi:unnamed protein product [Paramecium sonneborni]|uniref:RING-type domain-containing protein n=1 Tax=Paramecium sonneborni TaxID=65129 RepID=A0A8S1ND36_9CILI|nr:unnamed protein product [Paramecium sonneborni]
MYYPYAIEEPDISEVSGFGPDSDIDIYDHQDLQQTYSIHSISQQISQISESEDEEEEEEDVIDQSRIFNLAEVKVFLDEVICPICCHIIKSPKICKECDQSFCGKCIDKWFQKSPNQQCPCCRVGLNYKNNYHYNQSIMDDKVPKVLLKLLSKLFLTCKYQQDGCEEIITYDFREKHENHYCQYQEQVCENIGCFETMFRKDLEDHQLECKYGRVQCKYCSKDQLRMDIELHLQECDCRPILCEWCKLKQQAIDFDDHVEQCEFKDILCIYCQKKYKRYDMKYHTPIYCLKNLYQNSLEQIQQKDQKILELQKQVEQFKSNKLMEQSDLNQSTNEMLSEKYKQDFEEEVEEVIEEDIQIEESDSKEQQPEPSDYSEEQQPEPGDQENQDEQKNKQNQQQSEQQICDDENEFIKFYNNMQNKQDIFINERLKEEDLIQKMKKVCQVINNLK